MFYYYINDERTNVKVYDKVAEETGYTFIGKSLNPRHIMALVRFTNPDDRVSLTNMYDDTINAKGEKMGERDIKAQRASKTKKEKFKKLKDKANKNPA